MITLKQIQKRYKRRIPKNFVRDINSWIDRPFAQKYLKKALAYDLSGSDNRHIYNIGSHKGQYPKLYWLCFIYIHPMTIAKDVAEKTANLIKSLSE